MSTSSTDSSSHNLDFINRYQKNVDLQYPL